LHTGAAERSAKCYYIVAGVKLEYEMKLPSILNVKGGYNANYKTREFFKLPT